MDVAQAVERPPVARVEARRLLEEGDRLVHPAGQGRGLRLPREARHVPQPRLRGGPAHGSATRVASSSQNAAPSGVASSQSRAFPARSRHSSSPPAAWRASQSRASAVASARRHRSRSLPAGRGTAREEGVHDGLEVLLRSLDEPRQRGGEPPRAVGVLERDEPVQGPRRARPATGPARRQGPQRVGRVHARHFVGAQEVRVLQVEGAHRRAVGLHHGHVVDRPHAVPAAGHRDRHAPDHDLALGRLLPLLDRHVGGVARHEAVLLPEPHDLGLRPLLDARGPLLPRPTSRVKGARALFEVPDRPPRPERREEPALGHVVAPQVERRDDLPERRPPAQRDRRRLQLLDPPEDEHPAAREDRRRLVRRRLHLQPAPVDRDVGDRGGERPPELAQDLRLDPLAGRDELGLAAARPGDALHQVEARPRADPEGEDAGVRGVPRHEGDHGVGVADLAVGEEEDLPRQARLPRGREDGLEGGQDLGAAEVGLHRVHEARSRGRSSPRRTAGSRETAPRRTSRSRRG